MKNMNRKTLEWQSMYPWLNDAWTDFQPGSLNTSPENAMRKRTPWPSLSLHFHNRNSVPVYLLSARFVNCHYPSKLGGRGLSILNGPHSAVYQYGRTPR